MTDNSVPIVPNNGGLIPAVSGDLTGSDPNANAVVAQAQREVELQIFSAKRFPRNTTVSWEGLMQECRRPGMAKKACYSYPRGGKQIKGPAVYLARAAARNWGNLRFGFTITHTTEDEVHLYGYCWDLESGNHATAPAVVHKLIQRKIKQEDGSVETQWVKPDERDLREMINRHGAIAMRNAVLQMIPSDLIDDAVGVANKTLAEKLGDPEIEKKRLIALFSQKKVTVKMLQSYLDSEDWTAEDLVELNNVWNAIEDGHNKVSDYFRGRPVKKENAQTGSVDIDDMAPGDPKKHQGHDPQETAETTEAKPKVQDPPTHEEAVAAVKEVQEATEDEVCDCAEPNDPRGSGVCQSCLRPISGQSEMF